MANELGTKIFRQEARFIAGAAKPSQLPKMFLPQVAFVGKSNVGKSSLINTICRRKNLARVSHTPGRTRQINFFLIAEKLVIADLPGYGFAKVPVEEKQNWEKLILHYLQNSPTLKLVNLLIDARRGIKENDIEIMHLLKSCDKEFQIIFTKADKITAINEFTAQMRQQLVDLGFICNIIITSSKNGTGAKELQGSMLRSL